MFLCDSTDARRSVCWLWAVYWDEGVGAKAAGCAPVSFFQTNVSSSWEEGSQNCVKQTCLGDPSRHSPSSASVQGESRRNSGSRRKSARRKREREGRLSCSGEACSSFTLRCKIKLHFSGAFSPLGDSRGVRLWCIYTTTLAKLSFSLALLAHKKCKERASCMFSPRRIPELHCHRVWKHPRVLK